MAHTGPVQSLVQTPIRVTFALILTMRPSLQPAVTITMILMACAGPVKSLMQPPIYKNLTLHLRVCPSLQPAAIITMILMARAGPATRSGATPLI